jgi:lysozyme
MRLSRCLLVLLFVLFAGCGGTTNPPAPPVPSDAPAPACDPPVGSAHMGECVQQRFGLGASSAAPAGARGVDVAIYQGYPSWQVAKAHGLSFAYNQTGDGPSFRDRNFALNWQREKELGLAHGAYLFVRPGNAVAQADALADAIAAAGGMDARALPPALDEEVPGSYANTCAAAARLRARLHSPVVLYTSPGLWWGGPVCGTLLWGAEWGSGGYAFAGWRTWSAQQYSGGGSWPGVSGQVDLDVDHGLLAQMHPAPTHAQLHRELVGLYRRRASLRRVLAREGCRHHNPHSRRCLVWLAHGAQTNRQIRALHARHIY